VFVLVLEEARVNSF